MTNSTVSNSPPLTLRDVENMWRRLKFTAPDRMEIRYNPLTAMGRFRARFDVVERANRGPMGRHFMTMREDRTVPEGLLLVRNLEQYPKEPELQIFDLRDKEERQSE